MRTFILPFALFLLPFFGLAAEAQVPSTINFQGKLLNTANVPQNGTEDFTFAIYNAAAGGTQLWTETQDNIPVSNGVFSVQLGAVTPLSQSVFSSSSTYLLVSVNGNAASTRQQLVTSPYAFYAADASQAQALAPGDTSYIQNGTSLQSGAAFYVSSGTLGGTLTVASTAAFEGYVGIGTTSPGGPLDVEGAGNVYLNPAGSGLTGNVIIGAGSAVGSQLAVLGTGSSYALFVSTSTAGSIGDLVVGLTGNVGVGTTSPGALFEVGGGSLTVNSYGHVDFINSGTKATDATLQTGSNDNRGCVTAETAATSYILFANPYTTAPTCLVATNNEYNVEYSGVKYEVGTSSITVEVDNDGYHYCYMCFGQ